MEERYNLWSFNLIIVCIGLAAYSFYSNIVHTWQITPPNYILLIISLLAFTLGIFGFKDKRNWRTKTRSWLTIILSSLTSIALFLAVLFTFFFSSMGANEHIKTVNSPDDNYTIDFYRWDQGATGTFGVRGELNGPLWFKKRIYIQRRTEEVNIEWKSNDIVSINNHILNLNKGDTYGYQ
ncbi:membrane protein [Halalkalibacter okhensis]|uniref:Membrane protein n=1 Tax=Halalkalibacter okhensis TaxID=333138 RepID=A0A0B0IFV1_9BACI|nr:membrane protein [Halalkalibacter okhensis]